MSSCLITIQVCTLELANLRELKWSYTYILLYPQSLEKLDEFHSTYERKLKKNSTIWSKTVPWKGWRSNGMGVPACGDYQRKMVTYTFALIYRWLTRQSICEHYPTPTIDDLIHTLNGATVFSKLNLQAGYQQLALAPESRYITTFATHKGLHWYTRLNFGTNSARWSVIRFVTSPEHWTLVMMSLFLAEPGLSMMLLSGQYFEGLQRSTWPKWQEEYYIYPVCVFRTMNFPDPKKLKPSRMPNHQQPKVV